MNKKFCRSKRSGFSFLEVLTSIIIFALCTSSLAYFVFKIRKNDQVLEEKIRKENIINNIYHYFIIYPSLIEDYLIENYEITQEEYHEAFRKEENGNKLIVYEALYEFDEYNDFHIYFKSDTSLYQVIFYDEGEVIEEWKRVKMEI